MTGNFSIGIPPLVLPPYPPPSNQKLDFINIVICFLNITICFLNIVFLLLLFIFLIFYDFHNIY